ATAEAVDPEPPSGLHSAAAKSAVADDPGAEQRSGGDVVARLGDGIDVGGVRNARVRIPSVDVPTGECRRGTEVLVAASAESAGSVGSCEPRNADAVANPEGAWPVSARG